MIFFAFSRKKATFRGQKKNQENKNMLKLKHCVQCGRRIPDKITSDRFFCSAICSKKYYTKEGDPRYRVLEYYEKDYGKARVAIERKKDPELEEFLSWELPIRSKRTNRNAKVKKKK